MPEAPKPRASAAKPGWPRMRCTPSTRSRPQGSAAAGATPSSRAGSRTVATSNTASTTPAAPHSSNIARQPSMAASTPARIVPPMIPTRVLDWNTPIALPRALGLNRSGISDMAAGNAVASPMPTPIRAADIEAKSCARPVAAVAIDQPARPSARMRLRFPRSTNRAIRSPATRLKSTNMKPLSSDICVSESASSRFTGSVTTPSRVRSPTLKALTAKSMASVHHAAPRDAEFASFKR